MKIEFYWKYWHSNTQTVFTRDSNPSSREPQVYVTPAINENVLRIVVTSLKIFDFSGLQLFSRLRWMMGNMLLLILYLSYQNCMTLCLYESYNIKERRECRIVQYKRKIIILGIHINVRLLCFQFNSNMNFYSFHLKKVNLGLIRVKMDLQLNI